ncbi:MAG: helicase C-terminal domain-containing protein [Pirellulales bacterium]|nr:helicase C-terminal domain-containing protein [Pirellulales bacterium]
MLAVDDILGPAGRIAARLKNYEERPEQQEMAAAVAKAIEQQKHLIVEAGTGVGKSFGYLVPAILAATERGEANDEKSQKSSSHRIIVSTHTISLQEQLLGKDLPLLNSVIPREFTTVLVKGRRNYLSLRRLQSARSRSASLFHEPKEFDALQKLDRWSQVTRDGSRSDLDYTPDASVWDEVVSDSGNCMGRNCPTYQDCFYYQARRRMDHAQILVVNHALFFSDLALRRAGASLLPDADVVIFDEAHTLEEVASKHLGLSVSSGQVRYVLQKLFNDRTNKGLLVHYKMRAPQVAVAECLITMDNFFHDAQSYLENRSRENGRVEGPRPFENPLSPALVSLSQKIRHAAAPLEDQTHRQDFVSAADRLTLLAGELEQWCTQAVEGSVYWIESSKTRRGHPRVTLGAAPIDVGPALRSELFERVPSVVLTSATLAVGQSHSFDFFTSRTGIAKAESLRLGSPFNYARQAQLILVEGMPDPSTERDAFEEQMIPVIARYVDRTDGHAFVLFTNYSSMRRTAEALAHWFRERDLNLLCQADGMPRTQMLERFRAEPRSVLFGTDSFWQGVDVPGEALVNVIVTKLPFRVPTEPVLEARLEAIRAKGGNPFGDYQLPEAVLKLKQGFGRLIRSSKDHGMVVILDPRVQTKSYGSIFLQSLPDCDLSVEPAD